MEYDRLEVAAGEDQLLVLFVNHDTAEAINPAAFVQALADDAAARRPKGWRLISVTSMPMRQTGTAGNMFFQSGGQYATQASLLAIYAADPPSPDPTPLEGPAQATDSSPESDRLTT